ncbi:PDR/VanB family oxidoreductase [Marinomonas sp. THO17]|uniref:PDR/VanB family oxidoreductase n=1 Tax=Marinomonas sp. THO17 TaxID=3149048 RepID=UPI00336BF25F
MNNGQLSVRVVGIHQVAPAIREFVLEACEDAPTLLPFSPGSHVVVTMQDGAKKYSNPYSLLSDPNNTMQYKIAVRLQDQSRGGSVYMHKKVKVGDCLSISAPANLFAPYWRAKKHLMLAGGVGITPFLSFLPEMLRRHAKVELHYMFDGSVTGAYQTRLSDMLGDKLHCYDSNQNTRCSIADVMAEQPLGTHLYICGPESLLNRVKEVAADIGWPQSAIHYEAFTAPAPGKAFAVTLNSGKRIDVADDESLLDALEAADVAIQSSCRGGVCGRCFTGVLQGQVEHRDEFLSSSEKSRQDCMMPCVSRAISDTLVLDL